MKSKKKSSAFRGKVNANAQTQKAGASGFGHLKIPKGVPIFTATPGGKHNFDVIPYIVSDPKHLDKDVERDIATVEGLWYKKPFKTHRNVGSANDSIVCPTTFGKPCPICEHQVKRRAAGADKEELDTMKASLRNLYIIIPKGDKKFEEKPHIWDISQFLFQGLLNDELEENDDNAVFPDLEEGLTLKVRFDSKKFGGGKPYAEASRIDFVQRDEQYDESILEEIPNPDEMLKVLSYKEIEAKFFELEDVSSDDDEDEAPKPTRSKKSVKKPAKPVDEDEDEDDDDDDDEAPKKKVASKKKPSKPVDDDDDDDENDEAPKKKPVKKPSGGKKCPSGHRFGLDCEKFDECDDCPLWDDCDEAR